MTEEGGGRGDDKESRLVSPLLSKRREECVWGVADPRPTRVDDTIEIYDRRNS